MEKLDVHGLALALDPSDRNKACIVVMLPDSMLPCLCDAKVLPREAVAHLTKSPSRNRPELTDLVVESVPIKRGLVNAHLLTAGQLRGRLCSDQFVAALRGGCYRRAKYSKQAYYTLKHAFCSDGGAVRRQPHVIKLTGGGLTLVRESRAASAGVSKSILRCGEDAKAQLLYGQSYRTSALALASFEDAHEKDPTLYEKAVQVTLGGCVESMSIGCFVPCDLQADAFAGTGAFLSKRCGCGFAVTSNKDSCHKMLLRQYCKRKGENCVF